MIFKSVSLMHLSASDQPRPLVTEDVDKLEVSMRAIGLISPITVQEFGADSAVMNPTYKIVAGHHRVAAARALGWTEIDAIVSANSGIEAELIEIDENLCRAELTNSQRTKYTKRRKQIWEALHPPETNQRFESVFDAMGMDEPDEANTTSVSHLESATVKIAGPEVPLLPKRGPGRPEGFAAATAEATGMTKRAINRMVARAEALGDDTLDKVTNTSLDSGVELDALAKLDAPERAVLVERAAAGEQVSARTPDALVKPSKAPARTLPMRLFVAKTAMVKSLGYNCTEDLVDDIATLDGLTDAESATLAQAQDELSQICSAGTFAPLDLSAWESSPSVDAPTNSKLINLSCAIKQALRNVMDGAGCLSIAELAQLVNHEVKTAAEDEIDTISDTIDYLDQWSSALQALDVVAFAHRV